MANEGANASAMQPAQQAQSSSTNAVDVLVIGGGAAGLGVIASLFKRQHDLRITVVEPNEKHYYQPAWTLVGAGEFDQKKTVRPMVDCIPRGAKWVRASAAAFDPEQSRVILDNGQRLEYRTLIVCCGLKLDWEGVEGLNDALGKNGVTSNYRYDLGTAGNCCRRFLSIPRCRVDRLGCLKPRYCRSCIGTGFSKAASGWPVLPPDLS